MSAAGSVSFQQSMAIRVRQGRLELGTHGRPLRCQGMCRIAATDVVPPTANPALNIAKQFEEEVVVEGLLYVTAVQAASCLERYGDLGNFMRTAPPPSPLSSALTRSGSGSSQLLSEAVCLAMPPDNPTGEQHRINTIVNRVPRSVNNGPRLTTITQEVEERVNLELQACQRTALFNIQTQQVLQASAHICRQRRRGLLRALRASRDTTRSALQGSAALLESLMCRNGAGTGASDQEGV